jgi:hypothetical protein
MTIYSKILTSVFMFAIIFWLVINTFHYNTIVIGNNDLNQFIFLVVADIIIVGVIGMLLSMIRSVWINKELF